MVTWEAPNHPSRESIGTRGTAAGGRPGPAPSRGGGVRASEGTNPCTRPSFATKNVFDVLQDLSESIGGSPGPQLDAADGQPEPIVPDLHQSLVELLERPEILSFARRAPWSVASGSCILRSVPYAGKWKRFSTCWSTRELKSAWSRLACFRQSVLPTVGNLSG